MSNEFILVTFTRILSSDIFYNHEDTSLCEMAVHYKSLSSYVSAMVPVKTMKEYEMVQDVVVLFCETVNRFVPPHTQ